MDLLEVKSLYKTYGSGETAVKALKDVSFSVPKGGLSLWSENREAENLRF